MSWPSQKVIYFWESSQDPEERENRKHAAAKQANTGFSKFLARRASFNHPGCCCWADPWLADRRPPGVVKHSWRTTLFGWRNRCSGVVQIWYYGLLVQCGCRLQPLESHGWIFGLLTRQVLVILHVICRWCCCRRLLDHVHTRRHHLQLQVEMILKTRTKAVQAKKSQAAAAAAAGVSMRPNRLSYPSLASQHQDEPEHRPIWGTTTDYSRNVKSRTSFCVWHTCIFYLVISPRTRIIGGKKRL